MTVPTIYLSRKNLKILISKLDRIAAGEDSAATIIKYANSAEKYKQTIDAVLISAVEDDEYYPSLGRDAGTMHPSDEKAIKTE